MAQSYRVTGINLKRQALGEADLLVTIFTREYGVMRAVAKGAKKPTSKLGGRLDLFVVNDYHLNKGRSLNTILQGDTLHHFSYLGRDLGKLGSAQYWTEIILAEAMEGQAQPELFDLFLIHLGRLEACAPEEVAGQLVHGLYQLLRLSGVAPVLDHCVLSGRELYQEAAGFSVTLGGMIALERMGEGMPKLMIEQVNALQWLPYDELPPAILSAPVWIGLERLLRRYLEHYLQRTIHSAKLLEIALA